MKRVPLTMLVTLALFGVYRVYAHFLSPMTKARVIQVVPPSARIEGSGHASHAAREAAREFLPDRPWAQQAKFTWEQSNQKFIFFDEIGPVSTKAQGETRNQYRFRPFAMIVRNASRPDEPPTVLAADEARVTFKNKIDQFGTGDSGDNRIIGAELDTGVILTGPNGLLLTGRNFVFSEATRSLYSDEPLRIAYGPTPKSRTRFVCDAEDIAITLKAGDNDILGKDLPQITDFEHLTLRRNVRFNIDFENRGVLTPVSVTSAGSFEFNREQRVASFERDVQVVQRTSGPEEPLQNNSLNCQRMEMWFDEPAAPPAEAGAPQRKKDRQEYWNQKMRSLTGLSLHHLVAYSPRKPDEEIERVALQSDENSLTATMERISFDALEGNLHITDSVQSQIDRVDEKKGTVTRLLTRRLMLGLEQLETPATTSGKPQGPLRRKFGSVDSILVSGPGKLVHLDELSGNTLLTATWQEQLKLNPDDSSPERTLAARLLELTGRATVTQGLDRGVRADVLTLTLPPDVFDAATRGQEARTTPKGGLLIQRAVARGHVQFGAPEAIGTTKTLDVRFTAGRPPVVAPRGRQAPSRGTAGRSPAAATEAPPWDLVTSERIDVDVVVDPSTMEAGVRTASVEGPFDLRRPELEKGATDPGRGAVQLVGHKLVVNNEGQDRQFVQLTGRGSATREVEPARVSAGMASLEGQRIDLNRADSAMNVRGAVQVRWPLTADLTGGLATRTPAGSMLMDIGCADGLTFDGQTATFLRNVVVKLDDQSRLYCEELKVELNRRLGFDEARPPSERPEVRRILSPSRVRIEMYEFEKGSTLARMMKAELGRFEAFPQKDDGRFLGAGPGTIRQWQRGSFHFRVTPEASAAANRPASSAELPWNFVQLDFEGRLTGNLHQRYGSFTDRVKAMYAPVAQAQTIFTRQELSGNSESSKRAVWVGCDELNVSLSEPKPAAPNGFITLNAQGRVEMEGQKIQANAYQISFEEEKDIFELRGRGDEMASIYLEGDGGRGHIPAGSSSSISATAPTGLWRPEPSSAGPAEEPPAGRCGIRAGSSRTSGPGTWRRS